MIWPFMPNKMYRAQLFAALATKEPNFTVERWHEYKSNVPSLSPDELAKIESAADSIIASFNSDFPIRAILFQGHADYDLRKSGGNRIAFERSISEARAYNVRVSLQNALNRRILSTNQQQQLSILFLKDEGLGSTERVYNHPKNEFERSANRRVEVFFAKSTRPAHFLTCPHGGKVFSFGRGIPSSMRYWMVQGCQNEEYQFGSRVLSPCLTVTWLTVVDEEIDADSIGLCLGPYGTPQGKVLIT